MHKNAYFLEKSKNIDSASEAPLPNLRWPPASGGAAPRLPRCYSRPLLQFVKFIYGAMRFITPQKRTNNYMFYFFHTFAPILIFYFKLCSFCWQGRKNISCPRT